MGKRENRKEPVGRCHRHDARRGDGIGDDVLVREHHTLGMTRRPGGVNDGGEIALADRGGYPPRCPERNATHPRQLAPALSQDPPHGIALAGLLQKGEVVHQDHRCAGIVLQVFYLGKHSTGDDPCRAFGMAENMVDVGCGEVCQNGDGNSPHGGDGKEGHAPVGHVFSQNRNAITVNDTAVAQEIAECHGPFMEHPVGER